MGLSDVKIAVLTAGTRGDVEPYLALACALLQRGHQVILGAPRLEQFERAAAAVGVPFAGLGPAYDPRAVGQVFERVARTRLPLGDTRVYFQALRARVVSMYPDCLSLAERAELVVVGHTQLAGCLAAERAARPFVSGWVSWCELPTRFRPPRRLPNLGPRANALLWALLGRFADRLLGTDLNRLRRAYGLSPVGRFLDEGLVSPNLNLIAISPLVTPPAPDWPARHRVTGYWPLERPDWHPPPELETFVNRDPKPICISFGSVVAADPARLSGLLVEAVERSGRPAVLQAGWSELGQGPLPPSILRAGHVPHDWLFQRVAAVVHHGGAGTVGAALRAGLPTVVVPPMPEQRRWAARLAELGVAPRPIPRRRLTAERLARAITTVTDDPDLRERAAALGAAVRAEDGLGTAVRLLESYPTERGSSRSRIG